MPLPVEVMQRGTSAVESGGHSRRASLTVGDADGPAEEQPAAPYSWGRRGVHGAVNRRPTRGRSGGQSGASTAASLSVAPPWSLAEKAAARVSQTAEVIGTSTMCHRLLERARPPAPQVRKSVSGPAERPCGLP